MLKLRPIERGSKHTIKYPAPVEVQGREVEHGFAGTHSKEPGHINPGVAQVSTHLEDELAPEMARLAQPMGVAGLGEAIELDLRRADGPRQKQLGDALERLAGASDRRPQR